MLKFLITGKNLDRSILSKIVDKTDNKLIGRYEEVSLAVFLDYVPL